MSVSVVTTVISVSTLALATAVFGVTAWVANIVATAAATGPGYHLNRRWTWGLRDRSNPWREVLPFWVLSFAGLALSTVAVAWSDAWATHAQLAGATRTLTIVIAHLSGFGILWVVQFLLLDRVLFRRGDASGLSSCSHPPAPIVTNGAGVAGCALDDQRSARSGRERPFALPPCAEVDPGTRRARSAGGSRRARRLGTAVLAVGMLNAAVAFVPALREHVEAVATILTPGVPDLAAGATFVLGAALVLVGRGIAQRRHVAYVVATAALAVSAVTHVLEGSFFVEAAVSLALAATLFTNRALFTVPPRPRRLRTMAFALPAAVALAFVYGIVGLFLERGGVRPALTGWLAVREVAARLTGSAGPLVLAHGDGWLPVSLTIAAVAGVVGAAAYVLAPHRDHRRSSSVERARVTHMVRRRDGDTLDPFALRGDKTYVFSPDGRAAVAYRCVHGVGLASGDPIGDPAAFPSAIDEFVARCEQNGWRPAFMGARDALLPVYRAAGFRSHYLGDEAVIDVPGFNLDGRAMRPVRQAYNRTLNFGLVTEIVLEGDLPVVLREQLRAIARRARDGAPERGFSMALDGLLDARYEDCIIVVAREPDGTPLAFQRYVPCRGGRGLSLDAMRRDRRGPNGVNERMIVDMVEWAAAHGIDEVSLNFAFLRAWLDGDAQLNAFQAVEAWLVRRFNPYFQIESLLVFNAKFRPRWVPRHLVYRTLGDLPVVGVAAMSAEALLPFDRRREPAAAIAA